MKLNLAKTEALLRVCTILLLVLTVLLVAFDSQTKTLFFLQTKVSYKDMKALVVLVYVDVGAAVYNLIRLSIKCFFDWKDAKKFQTSYVYVAWFCHLIDQLAVYLTFAATSAALQSSVLVVSGVKVFQWMKWCNKFPRFCSQIGGALTCGLVACLLMVVLSCISAFNLFRLYSPKRILVLKSM